MPGSSRRDHKGSYFRIIGNDKNTRQIFLSFFGRNTHVGYSYMICKINYVMKSDSWTTSVWEIPFSM